MIDKCEHIIGIVYDYEDTKLVTLKGLKEHIKYEQLCCKHGYRSSYYTLSQYCDKRYTTDMTRFEFCPFCGEKIDWSKIKRSDNNAE